jgi:hypothetical protein
MSGQFLAQVNCITILIVALKTTGLRSWASVSLKVLQTRS